MYLALSCLALLPIILIIIALTVFKTPGHKACGSALLLTAALALVLWKMPLTQVLTSALEGFAAALWPIILVIIAAIFTYNLSLKTGGMAVIKAMLTSVSADRRILILLIGWCFGGFMEGMAGFGTAIAIPASMLAGLGMHPLLACVVCMLANAFPTAFGSVGVPTVTLATVTKLDVLPLSFITVIEMLPFMLLVPFLMLMAGNGQGVKALKGVWGITLVSGLSFVLPEILVAKFVGPELTVIIGSVVSLICTTLLAKSRSGQVPAAYNMQTAKPARETIATETNPTMSALTACFPFILILFFLLLTSNLVPPVHNALAIFKSTLKISTAPQAGATSFAWLNTPGIIIFIAALLGGLVQKASLATMASTFTATLKQLVNTIITIMSVLAVAKIMTYSGMISSLATLFVTLTGSSYPFVAPLIAAIGAFVTGSGTNTEVLLGSLQTEAAKAINVSAYWLAAANSIGAGIGKILSPQCVATAIAAVSLEGQDSKLLRAVFPYALVLLIIACLLVGLGASSAPF